MLSHIGGLKGYFMWPSVAILCFAATAEDMYDLVTNELLNVFACRLQVLTWVKVIGVLSEVFANCTCHGKTEVRVDVDLADRHSSSLAKHLFRNAYGIRHCTAVSINHLDILLNN